MQKIDSLADAEMEALKILAPELHLHGKLNMRAFDLIGAVVNRLPELRIHEIPLSKRIAISLLVQLSNDLRASSLLALRGYSVQAVTIVSSMFESAYCIAAIASDPELAQKWVNHDTPTRPFLAVKTMIEKGLKNLGQQSVEKQLEIEYRVYRQLCMAKHSNPLFQMEHGFTIDDGDVVAMNGPSVSENTIRAAWFAMEHATALAFIALFSFFRHHMSQKDNEDIFQEILFIGEERKQLEAEAQKRWGTEDPFPGKW